MGEPNRIEESRQFVLGEDERSYGIWRREGGEGPLERFPVTDEGFNAAFERFRELAREERRQRGRTPTFLWFAVLLGAVIWLFAGLLGVIATSMIPSEITLSVTYFADTLGYRLTIGGVLVLAAFLLIRWERRTRSPEDAASEGLLPVGPHRSTRWEAPTRWALVLGMAIWIVSALFTQLFFRYEPMRDVPTIPSITALVVEAIAFRVWVVALLLLLLGWGRAWLLGRRTAAVAEGTPAPPGRSEVQDPQAPQRR